MKKIIYILVIFIGLISCSEYQNILKSTDPEFKFSKAMEYYEKKDYMRATTLFDEVATYFRGTENSEKILYYLSMSYMGQKDYFSASEFFEKYLKTYPKGQYAETAKFQLAYCFYLDSPDARLDQKATRDAIVAFQEFVDFFPESEKVPEANKLMDELKDKLAKKEYMNAKLYYNLGDYLGNNNYESAVITAQNALRNFPSNAFREDLSILILQSKYQQAVQSVQEKKIERYRNAIDEYYNFINEFPEGKYRKVAEDIFKVSSKIVKD